MDRDVKRKKTYTRFVLRVGQEISMPSPLQTGEEDVLTLLKILAGGHHLTPGVSSTIRTMENGKAALAIISSKANPPELVQHVLRLAHTKAIPLITLKMTPQSLGKLTGLRSLAAVAVSQDAPGEAVAALLPFAQTVVVPINLHDPTVEVLTTKKQL